MEGVEDVVIVGAGIAGLTTALGLHRLGHRSLVLESSDALRSTGFALTIWANGWKALDAVGVGDSLREQHQSINGNVVTAMNSGLVTSATSFEAKSKFGDYEARCVKRVALLETLGRELPVGTIRFSSKVVHIEESGYLKMVHLADGTIFKTKVLIGCDGVNSAVAKWLGFNKPSFSGRCAIRGSADFKSNHGFEHKYYQFLGEGVRAGYIPCDDKTVYWFFAYIPSLDGDEKEIESDPLKMKQYIMTRLGKGAENMISVIEKTELSTFVLSPLKFRPPWEVLWGNISKGNVCVAGDALHPMTPDIGQGGGCALEDGVVLARCIVEEALSKKANFHTKEEIEKEEYKNIKIALEKYGKERKWRSINLISTSYMVGRIQQSNGKVMCFFRDNLLSNYLAGLMLKASNFDCGNLSTS